MEKSREYLAYVQEKLKERLEKVNVSLEEGAKEIENMHQYYWENYTEMDQYGYEDFDNQQALLNQVNANQEQLVTKQRLKKMLDAPFFGRVDFQYEDEDAPESFYIGIANFAREAGGVPLVYDWRAPVSGLFYDYDKGPAYYDAPGGRMEGEVCSKWQYKIQNGRIVYAFESDVKIDDEILRQELGNSGDVKLKNIIRTIQKEQNAIIRNTQDKILVIQGVAGSGKTSVALHRIAWLLYHDRKNLKSSNVLILSPNGVFSDYISHILPELGEEHIREMSFDMFAYRELQGTAADCEDRFDELERNLCYPDMPGRYHEKQSKEYMTMLHEFVLELEDELMQFSDFKFRGFQKTEREIMELFYYKFPDIPLLARMKAVMEYFVDEYETLVNRDFSEEDLEIIEEKFMKMYKSRDLYVLYNWFLERNDYPKLPDVPLEKRKLMYEDVYPVLYLKYLLLGREGHRDIRHLVIDEMQDYSYLQYVIINRLFSCRMTVLGDKAQTLDDEVRDVTAFLPKIFGRDIRKICMNKSYRNTAEITEYAGQLTDVKEIEPFERHGEVVKEQHFDSDAAALEYVLEQLKLQDGSYETAAVIAMTEERAAFAYAYLKKRMEEQGFDTERRLNYIDRDSTSFCKGLTITTFYLAKGLEFDQVFALFRDGDKTALHRQAKYIAATRAMHELYMLETEGE